MKKLLIITLHIILLGLSPIISAQQLTLKGKVVNQDNNAVAFADALLFKNDSIPVNQTYTDSLGFFSLKAEKGNYLLRIKQFGKEYFSGNIELNQDQDLGNIKIQEAKAIEGVTLTARKKLIEQKVDRLVYNIEN
ncbi:carboxypeptidase-like regulatory domain-containing protein [Epilithonimonas zeae]|uniref:carboxypeptidase-like regulatory domain-containing protein n=1 Tax=Epilithonimonas zeae TaxID=1416779 RepID=UPI00200C7DAB|nr:carboxypeptidase-like regulatory domain-containing protein [Epilithonimonas zeae]